MNKKAVQGFLRPVIIFFIMANALCLVFGKWLDAISVNHIVLMYANLILFLLTMVACIIHIKALDNKNPYAFVRGVTAASFMKLIVIAASVVLYLVLAGDKKSVYAVAAAMLLYIIYTVFEVAGAMKVNREKNG